MSAMGTSITIKLGVAACEVYAADGQRVSQTENIDWTDRQTRKAMRDVINRLLARRREEANA